MLPLRVRAEDKTKNRPESERTSVVKADDSKPAKASKAGMF